MLGRGPWDQAGGGSVGQVADSRGRVGLTCTPLALPWVLVLGGHVGTKAETESRENQGSQDPPSQSLTCPPAWLPAPAPHVRSHAARLGAGPGGSAEDLSAHLFREMRRTRR